MRRLAVYYRSTGPDRFPRRPPYFDKLGCLRSFLLSVRHVKDRLSVTFVNDGPVPDDRAAVMANWGRVVQLAGIGNSPSFRETVRLALEQPDGTTAYFAEDDYLYVEPAFTRFLEVLDEAPWADYVTLFDHLDRYTRNADARGRPSREVDLAGQHWRTVESTCMTFGARVGKLRADRSIVRLCTIPRRRPKDHIMWQMLQGIGPFAWKVPKRTLVGPVPSLATHCDAAGLAPLVDWAGIAAAAGSAPLD